MYTQWEAVEGRVRGALDGGRRRFLEAESSWFLLQLAACGVLPVEDRVHPRPPSGAIFVFDKKRTPSFRVDGHEWKKKKGTSHDRQDRCILSINNRQPVVYVGIAHSSKVGTFHRRCYSDLNNQNGIVMVQYLDKGLPDCRHALNCVCLYCRVVNGPWRPSTETFRRPKTSLAPLSPPPPVPPDDNLGLDVFDLVDGFEGISDAASFPHIDTTFVIDEFAPEKLQVGGGTKVLICLAAKPASLINGGLIPPHAQAVVYFDKSPVRGKVVGSCIVVHSPPLPMGDVKFRVEIDGTACESRIEPRFSVCIQSGVPLQSMPCHDNRQRAPRPSPASKGPVAKRKHFAPLLRSLDIENLNEEELVEASESQVESLIRLIVDMYEDERDLREALDTLDEAGFAIMHYSIVFGHERCLNTLLELGANPNTATASGDRPLHLATIAGNESMIRLLIRFGGDLSMVDGQGNSCVDLVHLYELSELQDVMGIFPSLGSERTVRFPNDSPQDEDSFKAVVRRDQKENEMMRVAMASMSLKDRCALSLGLDGALDDASLERSSSESDVFKFESASTISTLPSSRSQHDKRPRRSGSTDSDLSVVIQAMSTEERFELEAEARVIQMNIRKWLLRRSLETTDKIRSQNETLARDIEQHATKVQAVGKGYLARKEFRHARQKAIQVQAVSRGHLAKKQFNAMRNQVKATMAIQRFVRAHQNRKKLVEFVKR